MDIDIFHKIKEILSSVLAPNDQACLFGSRARGDNREDSDWDILIVVDREKLSDIDYDEISYPLRSYGWEVGQVINPILYTRTEWEQQRITPFYQNVITDRRIII